MHTLLTWLGNRDILNMEHEQSAAIITLATKSLIPFDKIVILSNKDENKWTSHVRMAFSKSSLEELKEATERLQKTFQRIVD